MSYETKPNTGAIFKNDKRDKDTQPHGKGSALIGGVAYWISAWTNDGPKGRYQSLKFELKESEPAPSPRAAQAPANLDDDIPF